MMLPVQPHSGRNHAESFQSTFLSSEEHYTNERPFEEQPSLPTSKFYCRTYIFHFGPLWGSEVPVSLNKANGSPTKRPLPHKAINQEDSKQALTATS